MRDRILLGAIALVLAAGIAAALTRGVDHVGPAACAKRVARALHLELLTEPSVETHGDAWVATVPTARLILRVHGEQHRVLDAQALAGPGADVLNRPDRITALNVGC